VLSHARRCLLAGLLCAAALQLRAWDEPRMATAAQQLGPPAVAALRLLQPMLAQAAEMDEDGRLALVNAFFNRHVQFRDDVDVWGVPDHWASPLETLSRGAGDCEDYAIAKYFSLLVAGVPVHKLRLVYVRAVIAGAGPRPQAHMVLAYYAHPAADPLVLDNLVDGVEPASRRADLTPVFSFNSAGLWMGVGAETAGNPVARLSPWGDVLAKARAEGFL
jgi:predicted transglutaminase-like cysteine proteinase